MKKVVEVVCEESGISMAVSTTLPGMHFYTANYIEEKGREGHMQGQDCVLQAMGWGGGMVWIIGLGMCRRTQT